MGTLDALLMDRMGDLADILLPNRLKLVRRFAEICNGEKPSIEQ